MATYFRAFDLWEVVEHNRDPNPLNNNPTVNQIKFHNEEKAKRFKALSCIHNAVSEDIFTRIMACESAKEAWDKLKAEFQGDEKSRRIQVLHLKRQFEGLKMREIESIKEFSSNIAKLVNQMRLLGEDIQESRVVEKVLVSLPEKFKNKICSLEDSKDCTQLSLQELINALQAVEQKAQVKKLLLQVSRENFGVKISLRRTMEAEEKLGNFNKTKTGNKTRIISTVSTQKGRNNFQLVSTTTKLITLSHGVGSRTLNAGGVNSMDTFRNFAKQT